MSDAVDRVLANPHSSVKARQAAERLAGMSDGVQEARLKHNSAVIRLAYADDVGVAAESGEVEAAFQELASAIRAAEEQRVHARYAEVLGAAGALVEWHAAYEDDGCGEAYATGDGTVYVYCGEQGRCGDCIAVDALRAALAGSQGGQ